MYLFIIAVLYRYIPTEQKESRQKVPFLAGLQWICIFLWTSALLCTATETLWLGLCDVPNGCQAMTQSRHASLCTLQKLLQLPSNHRQTETDTNWNIFKLNCTVISNSINILCQILPKQKFFYQPLKTLYDCVCVTLSFPKCVKLPASMKYAHTFFF